MNTVNLFLVEEGENQRRKVGQHHGDLRRALLDAALALIDGGEPSPSLRRVAREAGVSAGAPYHHFEDKAALLAAVAADGFARLDEDLASARGAPSARLQRLMKRYVQFALDHPAHYRTMFDPQLSDPDGRLEHLARAVFGRLVDAVARVDPHGSDAEAWARARQIWSLAHGAIILQLDGLLPQLGGSTLARALAADLGPAALRLAQTE
ncbi:MAG: WHG domain-containing protein [Myxococcota bacterium]